MADRPIRSGLVVVLVGLSEGVDVPADVVERAGTATAAARRVHARVVHVGAGAGEFAQVIAHPGVGRAPEDVTVALAAQGRVDDSTIDTILEGNPETMAIAGTPTSGLVAEVARRARARGLAVTVLEDACDDPDPAAHEAALSGPLGADAALIDTESWAAGVGPPRRRRRVAAAVSSVAVLALVITGLVIAHNDARNYYVLSPGSAPMLTASADCRNRTDGSTDLTLANGQPCARLIVPSGRDHGISGGLFMVDVLEGPATTFDYILNRLHLLKAVHDGSQLFPASSILGSTPADQLPCQNTQQMVQATTDAPVAALQRLGYDVRQQDFGAQIDLVMPGFPAAAAGLACNDVINSVNGQAVKSSQDVSAKLVGEKPGGTVRLGISSPGTKGPAQRTVQVQLTSAPAQPGVAAQPDKGFLGVELETRSTYSLPFNVSIQVGDIGGPSAGLALALGIIDLLSNGQLTGSHKVAATGTIAPDGTVGDVGGVAQKTVAVRKAGARVFLVPPQELQAAQSEAGSDLKVYAVQTLGQALDVLAGLGGKVPAPTSATASPSG
ncbi:MAG: isochorismatase family protein [Actinomycetota bacterium]|nr:isochorismatase family protein [Actinomycetota bacterium]